MTDTIFHGADSFLRIRRFLPSTMQPDRAESVSLSYRATLIIGSSPGVGMSPDAKQEGLSHEADLDRARRGIAAVARRLRGRLRQLQSLRPRLLQPGPPGQLRRLSPL